MAITVHGPYQHRNRWRIHVKEGGRTVTCASYRTRKEADEAKAGYEQLERADFLWAEASRAEEEAERARAKAEAATRPPTTVGDLIDMYEMYLRDQKQRRRTTVQTTVYQLRGILLPVIDQPAASITKRQAAKLYKQRAAQVEAATHHGNLRQARAVWRWAAKRQLVRHGIWDDVEPIGEPNEGKEQLHPYAAELLFEHALTQAVSDPPAGRIYRNRPPGAAAVLCSLIFGLRPGEVVALSPDDLGSGILRVKRGKSKNARRYVRIPANVWAALSPHVTRARQERRARVFPFCRDWVRQHVMRLCREVGVKEVCAHALRGTHATLAVEAGATAEMVARQLGHGGTAVTKRHYIDPAAAIEAAANRVFAELTSGGEYPQDGADPGAPDGDEEGDSDAAGVGNQNDGQRLPT